MSTVTRTTSPRWGMMMVAAAAVALTTFWSTMGVARADERTWTVKQVTGAARMHHNGDGWRALRVGDTIKPGSRVETTDGGRLLLVRPGDSIDVAPNSRFDVPFKNEPNPKSVKSHIIQTMGTLLFKITTRPENPFGVKTPYLAAVIKGTTFTVSVDGPRSALHVSHGAVEVTSVLTGQIVMVRPGMTAAIDGARGGAMQVLGQRRGDARGAGGAAAKGAAKAATGLAGKDISAGKGHNVIARAVGAGRVNVFESSRGLVHDLKSSRGPGSGPGAGVNAGKGNHTAAIDRHSGKDDFLRGAPVNANGIGNGNLGVDRSIGGGVGGGGGAVGGLGNGSGLGNGGGNGAGGAVGGGNGNAGGNGNGNAGGNGNGNGKKG